MSGISAVIKGRISEALVVFASFRLEVFSLLALFLLFPVIWPGGGFVLLDFFTGVILAFFTDFFAIGAFAFFVDFFAMMKFVIPRSLELPLFTHVLLHMQLFILTPSMHCNRLVNSIAGWVALFG